MKQHSLFAALLFLATTVHGQNNFIELEENSKEVIDGKEVIVQQVVKHCSPYDSLPVMIVTRVFNYQDDSRIRYLTGFSKKDGLRDFLIDSIFYDGQGNDTLTRSFVYSDNAWTPSQALHKRYTPFNKIAYTMIERPFKKGHFYRKEIFYSYNPKGYLVKECELECRKKETCDSTIQKEYTYTNDGKPLSTSLYRWKEDRWVQENKIMATDERFR